MENIINAMINNEIGRRWQKNGMDRIYVDMSKLTDIEYNEVRVRNYFNRYEWQNVKAYYDVVNGCFVVTAGNDEAKTAVIETVKSLVGIAE